VSLWRERKHIRRVWTSWFVRRGTKGQFEQSDDVSNRSLAKDRQLKTKTKVKSGQGEGGRPVSVRFLFKPTWVRRIAAGYCGAFGTVVHADARLQQPSECLLKSHATG
jgi:hypothetical protein